MLPITADALISDHQVVTAGPRHDGRQFPAVRRPGRAFGRLYGIPAATACYSRYVGHGLAFPCYVDLRKKFCRKCKIVKISWSSKEPGNRVINFFQKLRRK